MQFMVDEFNHLHDNINVRMRVIRWDEYYASLNSSLKNQNAPEIAVIHATSLLSYYQNNYLTDISSVFAKQNLTDSFSPALTNLVKFNNHYYALPIDMHPLVMYFNNKYLRQANLLDEQGQPIIQAGVAGFIDFLTTLKRSVGHKAVVFATPNDGIIPFWFWFSLYHQQDNAPLHLLNNSANFNNPHGLKALNVYQQLRDKVLWSGFIHDEKGYNLFKNDKAAVMITGVWANWSFKQNEQLDFSVTNLPVLFDQPANFGDSHSLVMTKQTDPSKRQASETFLAWMAKNNLKWALSGQVPANSKVNQSQQYSEMENAEAFLTAAESIVFYPKHIALKPSNQAIKAELIHFLHSDVSPPQSLKAAETKVNQIIEAVQ